MNTNQAKTLLSQMEDLDREIEAMQNAIDSGDMFAVVGGSRYGRPCRVEVTKDMAAPFLEIGLKSLQRRRSQLAARIKEL